MWDVPLRSLVVELALAVLALHSVIILLLRRHLPSSRPTSIILRSVRSIAHSLPEHFTLGFPLRSLAAHWFTVLSAACHWWFLGCFAGLRLVVSVLIV
jgi:hypothetical protein